MAKGNLSARLRRDAAGNMWRTEPTAELVMTGVLILLALPMVGVIQYGITGQGATAIMGGWLVQLAVVLAGWNNLETGPRRNRLYLGLGTFLNTLIVLAGIIALITARLSSV